jgi:tol-pal system protein YbgF
MSRIAGLIGAAFVALSIAGPAPALAQDVQSLSEQVERLQRELSDLERYVYASGGGTGTVPTGNVAASQEVRLQQLESELGRMNGKIEELSFRISQVSEQLDRMNKDIDFRLTQLEHGSGTMPPVSDAEMAGGAAETASSVTLPSSAGTGGSQTLGTMSQAELDAQLARQQTADPTAAAAAAAAPTGSSGGTTTASVITPYDLPGSTPEEQYEYAFGLLRQANYPEAEAALRTFLDRHPDDLLSGNAQYWLGETYYVRGNFQQAAVTFAEGYQKYPNSGKAPDNLLKLGMSLGELGKNQEACVALSQLRKQFPNAPGNIQDRAARERQRYGCS